MQIAHGVPLAPYTTFRVGGPAWGLSDAETTDDLRTLAELAEREGRPLLVLGGGSNVLISDAGFDGLVVRHRDRRLEITPDGRILAGAGVPWDEVVGAAVARGLLGVECLSGIPGWLGATPIQNIGAYGQEISETLTAVTAFDRTTQTVERLVHSACNFSYRGSRFKEDWKDRYIITSVELQLRTEGEPEIRYAELARSLGPPPHDPARVRRAVLELRRSKSMVLDDRDENTMSAGSFFMNPIVTNERADEVEHLAGVPPPRHPAGEGRAKLSAAWLIEHAGFAKGYGVGPAGLSTRHCLALVNRGAATAADLVALAAEIRAKVRAVFGVTLSPEPVFVGFEAPAERLLDGAAH